ncbi:unnamed protein product, partial [Allacma fusca]
MLRAAAL